MNYQIRFFKIEQSKFIMAVLNTAFELHIFNIKEIEFIILICFNGIQLKYQQPKYQLTKIRTLISRSLHMVGWQEVS